MATSTVTLARPSSATSVLIAGNVYDEDVQFISGAGTLDLIPSPLIGQLETRSELSEFVARLGSVDLLICRLVGADPAALIARLEQHGLAKAFADAPCRKVFWSQDSHHMHRQEAAAQRWFDRVYVAHHDYIDRFDPARVRYLPCAYTASSLETLYQLNAEQLPPQWDVVFPHVMYAGAERNPLTFEIARRLKRRNLRSLFAKLYGPQQGMPFGNLLYGLKSSRIVLNVSLSNDLNIRNFEAIALNRVLLTNALPDHQLQDLDYSKTHFFRRDLADFDQALDSALADCSPAQVWRSIPGRNMLTDRYLTIINQELGTDFTVIAPTDIPRASVPLPAPADFASAPEIVIYDEAYLLAHALFSLLRSRRYVAFMKLLPRATRHPRLFRRLWSQMRRRMSYVPAPRV